MKIFENNTYQEDVTYVSHLNFPWSQLQDKSVCVTGATGLLGSFLVDVIMNKNKSDLNCKVHILGRDEDKARARFAYCWNSELFQFNCFDINKPFNHDGFTTIDFMFHLASNTHPVAYANDPIGTINTNVIGTHHMLEFACAHHTSRFIFASSNEVYGENRGDVEKFNEHYCGYIDSNTLRAGYPESKRCGEALCQAYIRQKNLDIVVPRFTRSYGPTMQNTDTKAISQFIKNGVNGKDIVLKSSGTQFYSYTYVADAISGLLTVFFYGKNGEAYNIADEKSDITLKDLATIISTLSGKKVVHESPDSLERAGYSTATKARLDGSKIQRLGWNAKYSIESGIKRTLNVLQEIEQ